MGCITGIISKSFLVAFNVVVAVAGVIVLTLASIIQTTLNGYGDEIPQDPLDILIGLQTVSTFIICLGVLGVVVSCCCGNKLFLYTYFILGLILVVAVIVLASIGVANINNEQYVTEISTNMHTDLNAYVCGGSGEVNTKMDHIFQDNQCCGFSSANDMLVGSNSCTVANAPVGCCKEYSYPCIAEGDNIYWTGCYEKLMTEVGDQAKTTFNFAIFFGVLVFALLTSTCLCVKCTDTMPI